MHKVHRFGAARRGFTAVAAIAVMSGLVGVLSASPAAAVGLVGSGTDITVRECSSFSKTVATFTDSMMAASYDATVAWGDSAMGAGSVVTTGPNAFDVNGTHRYLVPGEFTITTSVTPFGVMTPTTVSSTARVVDVLLERSGHAAPTAVSGTEGKPVSVVVNGFEDDACSTPGMYRVAFDWGDGTTSGGSIADFEVEGPDDRGDLEALDDQRDERAARISEEEVEFAAAGVHTYKDDGRYTVTVTVRKTTGEQVTGTGTATIADAPVHLTGSPSGLNNGRETGRLTGTVGSPASGSVAQLRDENPFGEPADFSATINWGDGLTSAGAISGPVGGPWDITGSHPYRCSGVYQVTVTVVDKDGPPVLTTTTVAMVSPPANALDVIFDIAFPCR